MQPRKPMTAAQRAMAAKPSLADLRHSATARSPPVKLTKHDEFEFYGWTCRIYSSPYSAGQLLATADRPGDALSMEVPDRAAADAWFAQVLEAAA